MDWLAPLVSLLVALGLVVARMIPREGAAAWKIPWAPIVGALVLGGVSTLLSMTVASGNDQLKTSLLFIGVGLGASALLAAIESSGTKSAFDRIAPLAFGVALMLLFDAKQKSAPPGMLGLAFGAGLGAMWFQFSARLQWPSGLCLAVAAVGAANLLGAAAVGGKSALIGSALGTVVAVAGVLSAGSIELLKGKKLVGHAILAVIVLVGAWLAATRYVFLKDVFTISLLALVASIAVAYLLDSDEDRSAFPMVLATLVWVALATIAFGLLKGYGMAVGLVIGLGCLLALGSNRGLLSLGPAFAITMYRLFREQHADSSRALDIGQHYAIVGILVGLLVVLGVVEWARGRSNPKATVVIAGALAGLTALGTLLVAAVLLGPKGTVGLLIGFGIAPLLLGIRGDKSVSILATSVGFLAAVALAYGPLDPYLDLEREVKVRVLVWTVAIVLGLAATVRLLGGPIKETRP